MNLEEMKRNADLLNRDYGQDVADHLLQRAQDGKTYVCPVCGHGSRRSKSGLFLCQPSGGYRYVNYHCYRCQGYDIDSVQMRRGHINTPIDLWMECTGESFGKAVLHMSDVFLRGAVHTVPVRKVSYQPENKVERTDMTADFIRWANTLPKVPKAVEYLTRRGISLQTARRYCIGYCDNMITMPCDRYSAVRRYISGSIRYNNTKGELALFGCKTAERSNVVFVCEGAFDALSISEVGGTAIAINGAGNRRKAVEWIDAHPDIHFILALDSDDAGESATEDIASRTGVDQMLEIPSAYKDINEWLVGDRAHLSQVVSAINSFYDGIEKIYDGNSQNCDKMETSKQKSTACTRNTDDATAIQNQ